MGKWTKKTDPVADTAARFDSVFRAEHGSGVGEHLYPKLVAAVCADLEAGAPIPSDEALEALVMGVETEDGDMVPSAEIDALYPRIAAFQTKHIFGEED